MLAVEFLKQCFPLPGVRPRAPQKGHPDCSLVSASKQVDLVSAVLGGYDFPSQFDFTPWFRVSSNPAPQP